MDAKKIASQWWETYVETDISNNGHELGQVTDLAEAEEELHAAMQQAYQLGLQDGRLIAQD